MTDPTTSIWRRFQFWARADAEAREPRLHVPFVPEVWAPVLRRSLDTAFLATSALPWLLCWYCRYPIPRFAIECPTCGGPGDHPAARARLVVPAP